MATFKAPVRKGVKKVGGQKGQKLSETTDAERNARRKEFARLLGAALEEKDWSASKLAGKCVPPKSRSDVSFYLRAKAFPSLESARAIATALGVPLARIYPWVANDYSGPPGGLPYAMDSMADRAGFARLRVNMEVPITTAAKVVELLSLLSEDGSK